MKVVKKPLTYYNHCLVKDTSNGVSMFNSIRTLLNVRHPDEEVRQRGRNIIIIALGLLGINLVVVISLLFNLSQFTRLFATSVGSVILYLFVIFITFRGFVELAGCLMIILSLVGTITATLANPDRLVAIFLSVPLVLAATILSLRSLILTFLLIACCLAGITFFLAPTPLNLTTRDFLIPVGVLCGFLSVISFVQSAGNEALHRRLQAALQQAKQTADQLRLLNDELDRRVDAQTEALQEALSELEERTLQQDRLLAEVIAQRDVIRNLNVPVLPAGTDLLAIPLVGTISSGTAGNHSATGSNCRRTATGTLVNSRCHRCTIHRYRGGRWIDSVGTKCSPVRCRCGAGRCAPGGCADDGESGY